MIIESQFLKSKLKRKYCYLESLRLRKRWSEATLAKISISLLLSSILVRRLIDLDKISERTASHTFKVKKFHFLGSKVSKLYRANLNDHYDFNSFDLKQVHQKEIIDLIIHSWILNYRVTETNDLFILLGSERINKGILYELKMIDYVNFLSKILNDTWAKQGRMSVSHFPDGSVLIESELGKKLIK